MITVKIKATVIGPLRRIVSFVDVYARNNPGHGAFTARLELECGHTVHRKGSKTPGAFARCPHCRDVNPLPANGGVVAAPHGEDEQEMERRLQG